MEKLLVTEIWASFIGIALSGIWGYIVLTNSRYNKSKQRISLREFKGKVSAYFLDLEIHTDEKIEIIDEQIDKFHNDLKRIVKYEKISEDMYEEACHFLNQKIQFTRIAYIKHLFKGKDSIQPSLERMYSDNEITREELFRLLDILNSSNDFNDVEKSYLKDKVMKHCVRNDRIKTPDQLLVHLDMDRDLFLKEHLRRILKIVPFVLMLAMSLLIFYFFSNTGDEVGEKKEITIGFLEYKEHEKFTDFRRKLVSQLNTKNSDLEIHIKLYRQESIKELIRDAQNGEIDGFVLNPGAYIDFKKTISNMEERYEIFAQHKYKNQEVYHPVIIANRSDYLSFCEELLGNEFSAEKHIRGAKLKLPKAQLRTLLKKYLLSERRIAVNEESSMSGYKLALASFEQELGLSKDFILDKSEPFKEHDEIYTAVVSSNDVEIGATYYEALEKGEEESDVLVIYEFIEVPYNTYWLRSNIDDEIKRKVADRFISASNGFNEKTTPLKVTGWIKMSTEEYSRKFKSVKDVVANDRGVHPIVFEISEKFAKRNSIPTSVGSIWKSSGYHWLHRKHEDDHEFVKVMINLIEDNSRDTLVSNSYQLVLNFDNYSDILGTRPPFYNVLNNKLINIKEVQAPLSHGQIDESQIANVVSTLLTPKGRVQKAKEGFRIKLSSDMDYSNLDEYNIFFYEELRKILQLSPQDFVSNGKDDKRILILNPSSRLSNIEYTDEQYTLFFIKK